VVERTEVGLHQQTKVDLHTRTMLGELDADVRDIKARLASHEQQLERVDASG
jgi:BMFP domain-containing protein YqiC